MKKNIVILATGGTIAGSGLSPNQAGYVPATLSAEDLLKNISGVNKLANISCKQIFSISSQNITEKHWLEIAKQANQLLNQDQVDGIVITHGTDTMEETAYFLHLTVNSPKPIIITGAMRPATAISSDGPINLYNAIALACHSQAFNKGVLLLMADKIFSARDVSKINASAIEAFAANNSGNIGHILYGDAQIYYQPLRKHTNQSQFGIDKILNLSKSSQEFCLPSVEILLIYAGLDAEIVDYLVEKGCKAIVVAGLGNGNCGQNILPKLIKAAQQGVLIIKSSRTGVGLVAKNIELEDDKLGFITADNLSPQKTRILTKLALLETENSPDKIKEIQAIFAKY